MGSNSKKIEASCLILAGGQGRRLTPDKPLLEINKRSIIEWTASVVVSLFEEVLLVTNTPEKYRFLILPLVADERRGCGPLMGIYSGLRRVKHRTRRFYTELLEEWKELGLGAFNILEEDIAGIVCILVVPCSCSCGGRLALESDIRDSVKCRSVVMKYLCATCGSESEFSFCLPNVKGLPRRR